MKLPCVTILASKPYSTLTIGEGLLEGFTKRYRVHRLVYDNFRRTMQEAIRREKQLKEWKRAWKIRLIESMNPEWADLYDAESGDILEGPADLARERR